MSLGSQDTGGGSSAGRRGSRDVWETGVAVFRLEWGLGGGWVSDGEGPGKLSWGV